MITATQLATVALKPLPDFVYDKRKDGWKLVEDADLIGNEVLGLYKFLEEDESCVVGMTMLERAKKGPRAGQRHLERLLSQQADISKDWRIFYPVGSGTVWQFGVLLAVPCLYWRGDHKKWILGFSWLDFKYDSCYQLVRPCN